jgi:HCOMODA/2-hydroxy-3-carboxy-muconic semialdehyde decarboxylase
MQMAHRTFRIFLALLVVLGCGAALGQTTGAADTPGTASPSLVLDLVAANRILFDQGVVDGFGHVSVRSDKNPNRFLLARSMAPGLVTAGDIMEFDLDGQPVDARGRTPYLERFIHSEIYKARPDVMAIVHSHSPAVIPFGITGTPLRPVFHITGFLGAGVPIFEIRDVAGNGTDLLVRDAKLGAALARTLGDKPVALMRGHGSVAVGSTLQQVVYRAVYTEVNARLQADAMRLGTVNYLTPEEAAKAAQTNDALVGRPWDLWKRKAMKGE